MTLPTMTDEQYNKALAALGLDKEGALKLLGIDRRTHDRWSLNQRAIPGPTANFLRYLVATGKSGAYAIKKLEKA
jgi:hypothetical protein